MTKVVSKKRERLARHVASPARGWLTRASPPLPPHHSQTPITYSSLTPFFFYPLSHSSNSSPHPLRTSAGPLGYTRINDDWRRSIGNYVMSKEEAEIQWPPREQHSTPPPGPPASVTQNHFSRQTRTPLSPLPSLLRLFPAPGYFSLFTTSLYGSSSSVFSFRFSIFPLLFKMCCPARHKYTQQTH